MSDTPDGAADVYRQLHATAGQAHHVQGRERCPRHNREKLLDRSKEIPRAYCPECRAERDRATE
jgi:hypothetical protein